MVEPSNIYIYLYLYIYIHIYLYLFLYLFIFIKYSRGFIVFSICGLFDMIQCGP